MWNRYHAFGSDEALAQRYGIVIISKFAISPSGLLLDKPAWVVCGGGRVFDVMR